MGADGRALPVVAVVGRPNVGKSSLVNRVLGRREAIVEQTPGVTRDRRGFVAEWAGRRFEIVDTGGLEPGAEGLEARVAEQAAVAIDSADVIVLAVDAATGPTQDDHVVAQRLRRSGKPVLVAANKVDDPRDEPSAAAFYRLGLGDPAPLSALHGRGSGDFLERLVALLPDEGRANPGAWASAAIVGRPNVGKSSMLNALLGEPRAIVAPTPGTTRDPVDAALDAGDGRALRLVDTAGMRREVQIDDPIEYFGFLRSRRTLARVDVALLVVDAADGVTGHDQRIAEEIVRAGRACVVALNKWDLLPAEETDRARFDRSVRDRLRFLPWATTVRTVATTGRGVDRVVPALADAVESHRRRLATGVLNRIVRAAQDERPHPRSGGRPARILYAVQVSAAPPTIVVFATQRLEPSYVRYLERRIRDAEPFAGTPVRVEGRVRARE
ncbi:MAG TPA: ribosome biogenesis GTPase Der [Actinomycetota bacterium]|nr:ribosome biogenesis GTPase Der [Actinomycetota bacterium]